ncbi:MAG: pentapeptide repeat-containing protein [Clostridium sp.]|nr:MAG: pentapeptide repeat-containing protein [Clostridium sp.]
MYLIELIFSNVNLEDVSLTDCRFDNCDLSNKCFDKMFITRCEFINSKMVGASFIGAVLKDAKFFLW